MFLAKRLVALFLLFSPLRLFAADQADHQCRVFLTSANWNAIPGEFIFTVQTPNQELYATPETVKLLVRYHGGNWEKIDAILLRAGNAARFYGAKYDAFSQGPLWLDVIAFVETPTDRFFDHNWHYGNDGYLTLNSENMWSMRNLSSHCRN